MKRIYFFDLKWVLPLLTSLLFFQQEAVAMSLFSSKLCVFSTVEGTVLKDGEPVMGAVITRTYSWKDEDISEEVSTDKSGHFKFNAAYQHSFWSWLPHNPSILQFIKIKIDNEEYQAWGYQKGNYDENGELAGKNMKLKCELTHPESKQPATDIKNFVGICELY